MIVVALFLRSYQYQIVFIALIIVFDTLEQQ